MAIGTELTQKFNEAAVVLKFLMRMHEKYKPSDSLGLEEFDTYLTERTKAQYKGLDVEQSSYLAGATLVGEPDYTPSTDEEAEEFIKAMVWEIHATNNALNYDFEKFGVSAFQAAVAGDADQEAVAVFAEREKLPNILKLVR